MFDYLSEIFTTILQNKLRTALTGFAVSWGIFMLIVLLGAGNGLMNAFRYNARGLVMNTIEIYPGETSVPYEGLLKGRRIPLKTEDMNFTQKVFNEHIDEVMAGVSVSGVRMRHQNNTVSISLEGVFPNALRIAPFEIVQGRFINSEDMRLKRKVVVLYKETAENLFPRQTAIGKYVIVDGLTYQVVGVGDSREKFNINAKVPFSTLQTVYGKGDDINRLIFTTRKLTTQVDNESFDKRLRAMMGLHKKFSPTDKSAVWISNRFTQFLQQQQGEAILKTALWVIGLFTLLSGIVGVSNIMLITVRERTHEFGIRKALGAKPREILLLIVTESIMITTFFGYIGMVLGIAVTEYMNMVSGEKTVNSGLFSFTYFVNPTVDLSVAVQATLTLIVAGTLAGVIPAWKAARIRPIEALRAN